MDSELIQALKRIEMEKGLAFDTVLDALSEALLSAYMKNYGVEVEARVDIDSETGQMKVIELRENESGEIEEVEVTPANFGRIAAQTAKQVIVQRIREAERELMFDEYQDREGDIVTGIVQQSDHRYTLIDLGKVEALLPPSEQVRGERYEHGARLKTYIVDVRRTNKGPQIMVSRTHPGLLKRLFELEVPEIFDGLVEIKAIAREAGQRSKVAVESNDTNVDPVGACVGAKGSRVRMIVSELRGEKVDIVEWKEDPAEFIANAISPAKVKEVLIDPASETAEVVVPDNQLSLAIGKEGQNARLAAKMTGWRIDILSESQATEAAARRAERELQGEVAEDEERQCRAITASERRCRNKALPGSDFCGIPAHQKLADLLEQGSAQVEVFSPVEDVDDETEVPGEESAKDSEPRATEKSEADVGEPEGSVTEAVNDEEPGESQMVEAGTEEGVPGEGPEVEEPDAADSVDSSEEGG
ncbi:MAG: transcription termination factor NusA [Actinobacteria bacterium]|nr:transcription termination factor NusA [Actinomycetota bacterium]MCG2819151.1 transcription termination factor NusA [Actinomycetes bacterium]MBU4219020.1 transcription termination factor NusA [Actinomycetota bacterium]MBU4359208.1 transcription termination factor NusA [Actinomycetota bacterium]MBU4391523.1 transcription termination factor NusA [Actinomycetota bacterium]